MKCDLFVEKKKPISFLYYFPIPFPPQYASSPWSVVLEVIKYAGGFKTSRTNAQQKERAACCRQGDERTGTERRGVSEWGG